MKTMNWIVDTLNQLFTTGSIFKLNFQKNEKVNGKTPFITVGLFCNLHSDFLNISFYQGSFKKSSLTENKK